MGILRRLPAGWGARAGAEEAADSAAWATMELPGTVAASKPPEAARNCLRSIAEFAGAELGDVLSNEFLGHESWGRDVMRFTSANAAVETDNRLFCGIIRRCDP